MSRTFALFFAALTGFVMLCSFLAFAGVGRLKRTNFPPLNADGMNSMFVQVASPSDRLVLFVDSGLGHVVVWLLALPLGCLVLWHRFNRPILAATIMFSTAVIFGWCGLRLWIHAMMDSADL